MSITGDEVKSQVDDRIGIDTNPDNIIVAVNRALNRIGDYALINDNAVIEEADPDVWYSMPDDFTRVEKVVLKDDPDTIYTDYEYENGNIKFRDSDDYNIYARKMPSKISELTDVIKVHRLFENCIVDYVVSYIKMNDDPEDPDATRLQKKFDKDIMRIYKTLTKSSEPKTVKVVR